VYDKDFRFFLISAQKIYNLLVKPFAMTFVCLFFPSDLESNITGINEDLKNFESRLKFASEIQSFAEVGCNATLKINFTFIYNRSSNMNYFIYTSLHFTPDRKI